jgi:hypothetical protein
VNQEPVKKKETKTPRRDATLFLFFTWRSWQSTAERVIPTTGAFDASPYVSSAPGGFADLCLTLVRCECAGCAILVDVRLCLRLRLRRGSRRKSTVGLAWARFALACDRHRRVTLHRSREPEASFEHPCSSPTRQQSEYE